MDKVATDPATRESEEFSRVSKSLKKRGIELLSLVGSGAYARVYKGFKADKNRSVAIKVTDLATADQMYRAKFVKNEVEIMKRLRHNNIIKIYDIIQSSNNLIVVMEYAQNGTVADHIRVNGAVPEDTCKQMFRPILDALNYMHGVGIAHRDLKVENILLSRDNQPKLADFTHSKDLNASKHKLSETFCGTIPYFPPEMLAKMPYDPMKADVWSIGVSFYVMLNDSLPFTVDNPAVNLHRQVNREWSFRKSVRDQLSQEVKDLITKMFEPDYNKRPSISSLLNDPWFS